MDNPIFGVSEESERVELEKALEIFGAVIDSIDAMVYVVEMKKNKIIFANKMAYDILGDNVIGEKCYEAMFSRNAMCGNCPRQEMLAEGAVPSTAAAREMRSPVSKRWYWIKSRIITWHDGRRVQLCCANDITDRKQTEQNLIKLARRDMMTGIYSRDHGLKLMHDTLESMKDSDEAVTVCFMDVDGLKRVNDNFGHAEGDNLLIKIVDIVKRSTRSTDIFARMGGDEFLLVLRNTPMSGAVRVMETINKKLDEINAKKLYPYEMSLSAGIHEILRDGSESVDGILKKADREMYLQKSERRRARE